jgi:PAS domain-containing protein
MDMWLDAYRRTWTHESADEALAFYARVFDEAPAAIVTTDGNFVITDANVSAQQLFQKSLTALKGNPFIQNVARVDRAAFTAIGREITSERGRVTRPLLVRTSQDCDSEVSLVGCALRDERGEPEMVVLILLERGENVSSDIL